MKTIKVLRPDNDNFMWQSDVAVIVQVFKDKGYNITDEQAREIWERNSKSVAAGWLNLPANEEHLWQEMLPWWEEVENELV